MKTLFAFVSALVLSTSAFADYDSQYASAFANFERRGEDAKFAQACADEADAASKLAGTSDVQKYDALVLESRCLYYVGMKSKGDDAKKDVFGKGKNVADQAKAFQKDRTEAYFFFAINLGRWAEANGILKSLSQRKNLQRNAETASKMTAIVDGKTMPGVEYDGYGANRTLGRMYFKLPGMFGGDNDKAEELLREAVKKTPSDAPNSLNVIYLADVLVANGKKEEAKKILDALLMFEGQPEKYNAKRVPETIDEMKDAKNLRKSLGN